MGWRYDQKQTLVLLLNNGDELMTKPLPLLHKVDISLNVPHYFKVNMFVMNETKGPRYLLLEEKCYIRWAWRYKGWPYPTALSKDFLAFYVKTFFYLAAVNLAAFFINYHVLLLLLHNTFDKEIIDNHN